MHPISLQLFFSFSPADDRPPVGSALRFGFVSMLRLNLVQSLARRGITVNVHIAADAAVAERKREQLADAPSFGALLRRYRLAAGLSQEALAERARISVNGLSALERGTRRTPQRETLALLVEALDLTAADRMLLETAAGRTTTAPTPPRDDRDASTEAARADLLVVIATPAWYADDTCREELRRFQSDDDGARAASDRVFVVRRDFFEPPSGIEALPDRRQFDFFRDAAHARPFEPLYRNDGTPSPGFYDVVDSLAQAVHHRIAFGAGTASPQAGAPKHAIYVAPPASDMEKPYRTLVAELIAMGYAVLPADITAAGTTDFAGLDVDLADALTSIHLLGDEDEFDDSGRSRVSYPLARAAIRARTNDGSFRRILFAPKLFAGISDAPLVERDPIAVRDRFAEPLAGDTIVGDGITDFVLAVKELVRAAERRSHLPAEPVRLSSGSSVFLNFHANDVPYARAIARALRERGLRARFAAFEDDKVQNKITNAELVRESQAVVHCWASATDAWLYAEAADYEDWRKFGRSQPFRTRAAIAGPPERGSKLLYTAEDPPEAIDVYVDLTAQEVPLASDLDPIVATMGDSRTA